MLKKSIIALSAASLFASIAIIAPMAMADNNTPLTATSTPQTINLACVKAAVDKRETSIINTHSAFSTAITSAFNIRKTELLAAWDIVNWKDRNVAIKATWKKFNEANKTARKTFNETRKAAWTQFTAERKACKAQPTGESQGLDLNL